MKKFTTLKTLLVGLLACAATSAWAAVEVTETYDFYSFATGDGYITLSATEYTNGDETVYLANDITLGESTMKLSERFAFDMVSKNNSDGWRFRNTGTTYQKGLVCQWNKGNGVPWRISIVNLKANDKVTITYQIRSGKDANLKFANTNVKSGETTVAVDGVMASGTEYTVVSNGQIDLYVNDNNIAIHNVVIKTVGVETVSAPAIKEIGAKGSQRYVSMKSGTSTIGAEVSTYYTLNGDDPTSSSTLYTEPILVNGGVTVKAVSYSTGGTYSEISSLTTDNSGSLQLNVPAINAVNLTETGGKYTVTISATSNNASVLGNPTATLSATFDGEDVTESVIAGTFVPSKDGVLTVTAEADGYTSSNSAIKVYGSYIQTWQSLDYSSLVGTDAVQKALGTDWTLLDGHGRWSSWNRDKDGTYNFYQQSGALDSITIDNNIFMRNVVVIAEGMGLGRNVAAEAIYVKNTAAGDIVKFEIYNGYGNDINKGTNTYISYAISDGVNRPSMSSSYGALLVQAAIYRPATTTATIGDNGYATFASPYNVKLPTGVTAYTAKVSGNYVNFTEVESGEIPANKGVLLKGTAGEITLNVVATATELGENDFIAGTGAAPSDNTKTYFAMVKDSDPLAFGKIANGVAIPANKAYLAVPAALEVGARLTAIFDGEATGIKTVENAKAGKAIYNLNGQRVDKAQKGLYIVNGKKTIIK